MGNSRTPSKGDRRRGRSRKLNSRFDQRSGLSEGWSNRGQRNLRELKSRKYDPLSHTLPLNIGGKVTSTGSTEKNISGKFQDVLKLQIMQQFVWQEIWIKSGKTLPCASSRVNGNATSVLHEWWADFLLISRCQQFYNFLFTQLIRHFNKNV